MQLRDFVTEQDNALNKFVIWYSAMNLFEPEKFPLDVDDNNAGVWFEQFNDFDFERELSTLPKYNSAMKYSFIGGLRGRAYCLMCSKDILALVRGIPEMDGATICCPECRESGLLKKDTSSIF
jgi:hypothetical protein